jgi:hypothetical protein
MARLMKLKKSLTNVSLGGVMRFLFTAASRWDFSELRIGAGPGHEALFLIPSSLAPKAAHDYEASAKRLKRISAYPKRRKSHGGCFNNTAGRLEWLE